MNAKQFLLYGGALLIIVGVLGFFGVIGPTPEQSIFGSTWWFDNGENWTHLIIGIIGVIAAYTIPANWQRGLVMALGLIALFFGIYSIFRADFLGTNLENPADTLLHLAIGAWALLASSMKRSDLPGDSDRR